MIGIYTTLCCVSGMFAFFFALALCAAASRGDEQLGIKD